MKNLASEKQKIIEHIGSGKKKITVIAGLSKNAGKSTLLNWLISNCKGDLLGVVTTGRDGESYDVMAEITGKEANFKPSIYVPGNALFVTGTDIIRKNSSSITIKEKLPYKAAGRNLWLVKADVPIETEILGPGSVTEQISIADRMLSYGAKHIFIDGSFDRKAIALSPKVDNILIAVSPCAGNLERIQTQIDELNLLTSCNTISIPEEKALSKSKIVLNNSQGIKHIALIKSYSPPEIKVTPFSRLIGHENELLELLDKDKPDTIYLPTSVTENSFKIIAGKLFSSNLSVIIPHPLMLFLGIDSLAKLLPRLKTIRKLSLKAISVNSFAADGNHLDCSLLRKTVRNRTDLPVVDVMESGLC